MTINQGKVSYLWRNSDLFLIHIEILMIWEVSHSKSQPPWKTFPMAIFRFFSPLASFSFSRWLERQFDEGWIMDLAAYRFGVVSFSSSTAGIRWCHPVIQSQKRLPSTDFWKYPQNAQSSCPFTLFVAKIFHMYPVMHGFHQRVVQPYNYVTLCGYLVCAAKRNSLWTYTFITIGRILWSKEKNAERSCHLIRFQKWKIKPSS